MTSLFSFLKNKKEIVENYGSNDLYQKIENLSINNNQTMAKSAQSLNVLQSLKVLESLKDFTVPSFNELKEEGFKFKDGSIILKSEGRLNGLSLQESSLWEKGIYFKNSIEVSMLDDLAQNKKPVEKISVNKNTEVLKMSF